MQLSYPVIVFDRKGEVFSIPDEDILTRCGEKALREGYHRGLLIVDSSGREYRVVGAEQVGYATPFWGYSLIRRREFRIALNFDGPATMVNLDKLKELACNAIDRYKRRWESRDDVECIKGEVRKFKTPEEIIRFLM